MEGKKEHNKGNAVAYGVIGGIIMLFLVNIAALAFFIRQKHQAKELSDIICGDCNIVLVSFDTLRAKNVHFLGYPRNTTPHLDILAKKGFYFTNAISAAPWTLPATMSIFTGLYPSEHGITNKMSLSGPFENDTDLIATLSSKITTAAEIFKKNGYATAAFTGGAGVNGRFGFGRGFDTYTAKSDFGGFRENVAQSLQWIKQNRNKKMFIFLHGYDVHGQFMPPGGCDRRFVNPSYSGSLNGTPEQEKALREEGLARGNIFLTKQDVDYLTAIYDEKIQRADEEFQLFMDEYAKLGLTDRTIFIITSDHGEELYEHGRIDHGHSLYDELIHVPLILLTPHSSGKKIDSQVRSIDILPTILSLVGIKPEKTMNGVSLVPLLTGHEMSLNAFSETDYRFSTKQRSIRTPDKMKGILNLTTNTFSLFNLRLDEDERNNAVKLQRNYSKTLKEMILDYLYFTERGHEN